MLALGVETWLGTRNNLLIVIVIVYLEFFVISPLQIGNIGWGPDRSVLAKSKLD